MADRFPLLKFLAFAAVCLAFAVWLVSVIGNLSFESRQGYAAEFTDVSGLLVNDAVKISGVTVGKVTGIEVQPGGTARVDFAVRDDIRLGEDSTVEIRWRDVFGLRFLYVNPAGDGQWDPERTFPDERTFEPADLGALLTRLSPVMRGLDPEQSNKVLRAFETALVERVGSVRQLLEDGASLMQTLAARDEQIDRLLRNSASLVDAYAAREQQLRDLLDSFAEVSETVAARNDMLESAIVRIADAQEELRRLLETNDPELRAALDELDDITAVLSFNRDNIERIVKFSYQGIVSYHRNSRWGQWFNIRAVGFGSGGEQINGERGAEMPEENGSGSTAASLRELFGADDLVGRARTSGGTG